MREDDTAHALVNDSASVNKPLLPLSSSAQATDLYWNGSDEYIRGWIKEFQSTISVRAPNLHTLATESVVHDAGKVIIFCSGQAAQLEGDMPRPAYDWDNPAPIDKDSYPITREAIEAAYARLHQQAFARSPSTTTALPEIPANAVYPIDTNNYRISVTVLKNYNNQLRNQILSTIQDLATRTMLGDQFPTDGRALLQHLRDKAEQPLKTSQVNSILAQIDSLVNIGIKYDDAQSFREFTVHYHRILRRIPPSNSAKDTPAIQAMRYVKAVMKNREEMGRAIMNHFASHNTDHNDPNSVQSSLCNFLEDHATVQRLCSANLPPAKPASLPALPDINDILQNMNNMQTEIKALYSAQSLVNDTRDSTNRDPRKGRSFNQSPR